MLATMTVTNSAERALKVFQAQIGAAEALGEWHTIDQEQINRFAAATLDRQFIHVDPRRAAEESPYGTTIAHGFLTLSLVTYLTESIPKPDPNPYEGVTVMINYGLDRVRFPSAVKVNSRLRVRRELLSAELRGERQIRIKQRLTVEVAGEKKPACVAEGLALVLYE